MIGLDAVGRRVGPIRHRWTSTDCLLYALGVGAGTADLHLTTENSAGVDQRVVPTFAVLWSETQALVDGVTGVDPTQLVHGEQGVEWLAALPVEAEVDVTAEITGIYDKGSGAVIAMESIVTPVGGANPLFRLTSTAFARGAGGFGGDRGPAGPGPLPDHDADAELALPTGPDQALLYRLNGDRNPLHSDPTFATRAGFPRPILHGLCTYGITCRALVDVLTDGDGDRLTSMWGRFSAPVFPGEELTVQVWRSADGVAAFRTVAPDGRTVLDRGTATYVPTV